MREKSGLDLPVIERFLPESRRSHPQAGAATLLLMRQRASGLDCRGASGSAPSPRFAARTCRSSTAAWASRLRSDWSRSSDLARPVWALTSESSTSDTLSRARFERSARTLTLSPWRSSCSCYGPPRPASRRQGQRARPSPTRREGAARPRRECRAAGAVGSVASLVAGRLRDRRTLDVLLNTRKVTCPFGRAGTTRSPAAPCGPSSLGRSGGSSQRARGSTHLVSPRWSVAPPEDDHIERDANGEGDQESDEHVWTGETEQHKDRDGRHDHSHGNSEDGAPLAAPFRISQGSGNSSEGIVALASPCHPPIAPHVRKCMPATVTTKSQGIAAFHLSLPAMISASRRAQHPAQLAQLPPSADVGRQPVAHEPEG
jgi:hypothetical protein